MTKARISAGKRFFTQFKNLATKNKSIIIDELKNKDYIISIFFIYVSTPEECVHRIKQRVLKGEHYISDSDITRRFYRGKSNFWKIYRFSVDFWCLIDNSSYNFDEIAVGIKDEYRIVNNKLYKIFVRNIKQ